MSKFLLLKMVLVLGFANLSQAQTIKSIHRTDLPTLHVPIHLIDKVETVLENNVRKLKITQTSGNVIEIQTQTIDSITHQQGQAVDPTQLGELRTASAIGVVRDEQGNAVPMALVKSAFSPHQTTTDSNGVFFLNNFIVYDKLGFITIEKPGYFKGSRSFLPLQSGASRLEIQLLQKTLSGTFNSTSGGQITAGSLQINFPSNGIVQANGQPYTGTVNVFASALDPSSQAMFDQMPGELLGGMNDSLVILRSFGMAAVELFGNNNEPLQLASGQNATLRFTIPADLMNEAPETIDWWSFDEEAGYWKHEGTAQKQGNEYIGLASHFSWWNVDYPIEFYMEFIGVVSNNEGNPLSGALVEITSPLLGKIIRYTNAEGRFSGIVSRNENLMINIKLTCLTPFDWTLIYSDSLFGETEVLESHFTGNLDDRYPVSGILVNCEGQAVTSGYVIRDTQVFFTNNGHFEVQNCITGNIIIRGFDTSIPGAHQVSLPLNVEVTSQGADVGNFEACSETSGSLTDIDGNVYQTVVIGTQDWMVSNLKTSRFANGDLIPNITENAAWAQLSSPAWCNYENNSAYDAIYGKLYNWFTVSDPRNVCPDGWHVPSVDEWNVLREFVGGQAVAGGKMKTTSGWELPNTGATNESGFSALPAGYRWFNDGSFTNLTFYTGWWTSTEFDNENAFYRFITHTSSALSGNYTFGKKRGFSIRCIRD